MKKIVLVVTGGIAAYKAAEIVSALRKESFAVRVIMTPSTERFVGRLTFEALSGQRVFGLEPSTFFEGEQSSIEHIELAKWADLVCIAPATANTLAKMAHGFADNETTAFLLALPAKTPCLVCPAMNTQMWDHPATQRNIEWLKKTGRYTFVEPVSKRLACGDIGVGGLAEIADILENIRSHF